MALAGGNPIVSAARKQRVVLVMQYYDPEPVYKGQEFAEAVSALGYDVEVVTGFPNYPHGKLYPGYRMKPIERFELNNIRVTRLPLFPNHSHSRIGRVLNYGTFFLSALLYLIFCSKRFDLIYAYHPPLTVGLAAAIAGLLRRRPVVVDIHDLWPDTLTETAMLSNERILKAIGAACGWMYRNVDHVVLHSEGFRQKLISRQAPVENLSTIIGWGNELVGDKGTGQLTVPPAMSAIPGMKVLFAGNMGHAQALETILDAAAYIKKGGRSKDVSFVFLGSGVELANLEAEAKSRELSNVVFLPRVSPSEVGAYLQAADCLLVHLRNRPLFEITIPSKTQSYMIAGKPILMAVRGEAASLVQAARAGIVAKPEDPESIAKAALAFADMTDTQRRAMGEAGNAYYWKELSMRAGVKKLTDVFEVVLSAHSAS